jgi:hypothetical protein
MEWNMAQPQIIMRIGSHEAKCGQKSSKLTDETKQTKVTLTLVFITTRVHDRFTLSTR